MNLKSLINAADSTSSNIHLKMYGEKPALSTFLFHACLQSDRDFAKNHLYPQERLTVTHFQNFIEYFLNNGYQFIGPDHILEADPRNHQGKYAMITFDDGYYNNVNVLPVLEHYRVPAVFYIPTAYLYNGKKFWSDAIYSGRKAQNKSDDAILKEVMQLKKMKLPEIENYICQHFGAAALDATDDFSRFMTESEFINFANHPQVIIGNHTHNHEVLTNLTQDEVLYELETSREHLKRLLGTSPDHISYPNGSYNSQVAEIAFRLGMHIGITTVMEKNYLPLSLSGHEQLLLHRFNPVVKNNTMALSKFRADFQLKTRLKKWLR